MWNPSIDTNLIAKACELSGSACFDRVLAEEFYKSVSENKVASFGVAFAGLINENAVTDLILSEAVENEVLLAFLVGFEGVVKVDEKEESS